MNEFEVSKELAKMSLQTLLMCHEILEEIIRKTLQSDRTDILNDSMGATHVSLPHDLNQELVRSIATSNGIFLMEDEERNEYLVKESDVDKIKELYESTQNRILERQKKILEELNIPFHEYQKSYHMEYFEHDEQLQIKE